MTSPPRNPNTTANSRRVKVRARRALVDLLAATALLEASADPDEQTVLVALVRRLDALRGRAELGLGGRP